MKKLFFAILALMFVLALTCYEWNGIFITEGALTGAGIALAEEIQKKKK